MRLRGNGISPFGLARQPPGTCNAVEKIPALAVLRATCERDENAN